LIFSNFNLFEIRSHLPTYGVKETELNKEPVHLGFVYHQKFERIEELNSILTLLIAEEIDPDKEFYSQQY
jgi:hypothetical protein